MKKKFTLKSFLVACVAILLFATANAQCVPGCGTGTDGAYVASSNTTLAGGTYNYTSFTINSGVTVTVTGTTPLVIYCTGNVQIDGILNLNGQDGANGVTSTTYGVAGLGVAGGHNGGDGSYAASVGPLPGIIGTGPGAGGAGGAWSGAGGAGYATNGQDASAGNGLGGPAYGNAQITTIDGGSGGGGGSGGYECGGGGGGGGGGYVAITSCGTITISATGSILSNGGNGGSDGTGNCGGGGGGSGGSILLLTGLSITNNGTVSAAAGTGGASNVSGPPYYGTGAAGAVGRIFYSSGTLAGAGSTSPAPATIVTLSATATATDAICFGGADGTATVTASGGSLSYTYQWQPSGGTNATATNLAAGTYTVTVADATCTATVAVTIGEPAQLSSASTSSAVTCSGNCDATLVGTVFGGTPGYAYLWTPGNQTTSVATGLCAGTYTFTGTDAHGCVTTTTAIVTSPSPVAATATQVNNVTCNGGCDGIATIVSTGGSAPYTFMWSPTGGTSSSYNNLCPGTYTVTVMDSNGCSTTVTFTITEPTALTASSTHVDESSSAANDGTATVTPGGGTPGYTYSWAPSGGTGATATGLDAGTYTCTITDSNGCTTTATVTIGTMNGINALATAGFEVDVFPNPAGDHVQVAVDLAQKGNVVVEVFNLLGERVDAVSFENVTSMNKPFDTSRLNNGVYFFRISSGAMTTTKKITVSH